MPAPRRVGVYRFEDLRVWQAAKQQCDHVGGLLKRSDFQRDRELSGQINDAALSVIFNIAEGFLRRRDKETLQFLRYAFASNGELKSGYYAAAGRSYLSSTEQEKLIGLNEGISKCFVVGRRRSILANREGVGRSARDGLRTKDQGRTKNQRTKDQGLMAGL